MSAPFSQGRNSKKCKENRDVQTGDADKPPKRGTGQSEDDGGTESSSSSHAMDANLSPDEEGPPSSIDCDDEEEEVTEHKEHAEHAEQMGGDEGESWDVEKGRRGGDSVDYVSRSSHAMDEHVSPRPHDSHSSQPEERSADRSRGRGSNDDNSDATSHDSGSSHAMDAHLSQDDDDNSDYNNSSRRFIPAYIDYDGQLVFKKSDNGKKRSVKRTIYEALRGRAMPIRPLLASVLWSIAATVITWLTRKGYQPHENGDCRWWCSPLAIDGDALSYVGFALFLLTTFRVQESYARYMEAVRVWTNIGGTITSFSKYVCQAFEAGMFHRGDRERLLGFLAAFPVALKRELRNERDLRELKGVLAREDLAKLQNAPSMPSYCLYVLSGYCLNAKSKEHDLPQAFLVHLIRWIADLAAAADNCNQVKTMPAPYSYISHLNMFLGLWLFFLPFALVETTGWGTILIVTFISYGLLGVVQNAAELENPFGTDYNDLPLGRLARNIQDAVADTYRNSKRGREFIVREVGVEQLKEQDDYWLREKKKDK